MTGRPTPRNAAPPTPGTSELTLYPGTVRTDWCVVCKAWTQLIAELFLLSPGGVSTLGTLKWCEVCEDPDCPLPVRRIDRG